MPNEKKPPIDRFSYNDDELKTLIVEKADENKTDNETKKEEEKKS